MSRAVDIATRSAWARPICLGTSSPNTIVNRVSRIGDHDERRSRSPRYREGRRSPRPSREIVDEADRRERRGEEAQEVDADLDDRQEAARVGLEVLDADRRPVALVDELLDAAAPERDERDLGGREDAVEQDEDDDERELEERAGHEDASPAAGSDGALGSASAARPGPDPPRVSRGARGCARARRPPACRPARPS